MPRLSPPLAEPIAVLVELPIILTVSWFVCRWLVSRFGVARTSSARLLMGAVAIALLLTAEVLLGTLGFGRTLSAQIQRFRELPEVLGLLGQLAFAFFPALQLLLARKR